MKKNEKRNISKSPKKNRVEDKRKDDKEKETKNRKYKHINQKINEIFKLLNIPITEEQNGVTETKKENTKKIHNRNPEINNNKKQSNKVEKKNLSTLKAQDEKKEKVAKKPIQLKKELTSKL